MIEISFKYILLIYVFQPTGNTSDRSRRGSSRRLMKKYFLPKSKRAILFRHLSLSSEPVDIDSLWSLSLDSPHHHGQNGNILFYETSVISIIVSHQGLVFRNFIGWVESAKGKNSWVTSLSYARNRAPKVLINYAELLTLSQLQFGEF